MSIITIESLYGPRNEKYGKVSVDLNASPQKIAQQLKNRDPVFIAKVLEAIVKLKEKETGSAAKAYRFMWRILVNIPNKSLRKKIISNLFKDVSASVMRTRLVWHIDSVIFISPHLNQDEKIRLTAEILDALIDSKKINIRTAGQLLAYSRQKDNDNWKIIRKMNGVVSGYYIGYSILKRKPREAALYIINLLKTSPVRYVHAKVFQALRSLKSRQKIAAILKYIRLKKGAVYLKRNFSSLKKDLHEYWQVLIGEGAKKYWACNTKQYPGVAFNNARAAADFEKAVRNNDFDKINLKVDAKGRMKIVIYGNAYDFDVKQFKNFRRILYRELTRAYNEEKGKWLGSPEKYLLRMKIVAQLGYGGHPPRLTINGGRVNASLQQIFEMFAEYKNRVGIDNRSVYSKEFKVKVDRGYHTWNAHQIVLHGVSGNRLTVPDNISQEEKWKIEIAFYKVVPGKKNDAAAVQARLNKVLLTGNLRVYGYKGGSWESFEKAVTQFRKDICLAIGKNILSIDELKLFNIVFAKSTKGNVANINPILAMAYQDAIDKEKNNSTWGIFGVRALKEQMKRLGLEPIEEKTFWEKTKELYYAMASPFYGDVSSDVKAKWLTVKKGQTRTAFEIKAEEAFSQYKDLDSPEKVRTYLFKLSTRIEVADQGIKKLRRRGITDRNYRVKLFYYIDPHNGERRVVNLVGGRGSDDLYHYMDPVSGDIFSAETEAKVWTEFIKNNSTLKPNGYITYYLKGKLQKPQKIPWNKKKQYTQAIKTILMVGALVASIFSAGAGVLGLVKAASFLSGSAMAMFAASLGIETYNICDRLRKGEEVSSVEWAMFVVEFCLIGGGSLHALASLTRGGRNSQKLLTLARQLTTSGVSRVKVMGWLLRSGSRSQLIKFAAVLERGGPKLKAMANLIRSGVKGRSLIRLAEGMEKSGAFAMKLIVCKDAVQMVVEKDPEAAFGVIYYGAMIITARRVSRIAQKKVGEITPKEIEFLKRSGYVESKKDLKKPGILRRIRQRANSILSQSKKALHNLVNKTLRKPVSEKKLARAMKNKKNQEIQNRANEYMQRRTEKAGERSNQAKWNDYVKAHPQEEFPYYFNEKGELVLPPSGTYKSDARSFEWVGKSEFRRNWERARKYGRAGHYHTNIKNGRTFDASLGDAGLLVANRRGQMRYIPRSAVSVRARGVRRVSRERYYDESSSEFTSETRRILSPPETTRTRAEIKKEKNNIKLFKKWFCKKHFYDPDFISANRSAKEIADILNAGYRNKKGRINAEIQEKIVKTIGRMENLIEIIEHLDPNLAALLFKSRVFFGLKSMRSVEYILNEETIVQIKPDVIARILSSKSMHDFLAREILFSGARNWINIDHAAKVLSSRYISVEKVLDILVNTSSPKMTGDYGTRAIAAMLSSKYFNSGRRLKIFSELLKKNPRKAFEVLTSESFINKELAAEMLSKWKPNPAEIENMADSIHNRINPKNIFERKYESLWEEAAEELFERLERGFEIRITIGRVLSSNKMNPEILAKIFSSKKITAEDLVYLFGRMPRNKTVRNVLEILKRSPEFKNMDHKKREIIKEHLERCKKEPTENTTGTESRSSAYLEELFNRVPKEIKEKILKITFHGKSLQEWMPAFEKAKTVRELNEARKALFSILHPDKHMQSPEVRNECERICKIIDIYYDVIRKRIESEARSRNPN